MAKASTSKVPGKSAKQESGDPARDDLSNYDRHLLFDHVISSDNAGQRERFEAISRDPQYRKLHERLEFRATLDLLREYSATLSENPRGTLSLPPPPVVIPGPAMR